MIFFAHRSLKKSLPELNVRGDCPINRQEAKRERSPEELNWPRTLLIFGLNS
jgi:hypothetical protein